jgi:tetratricopeptide (TPR) repeat protein
MTVTIISIIIIAVCLAGVVFIVVRRLPQIRILKIDTIKEEKEARVRDRILRERLNRGSVKMQRRLKNFFAPLKGRLKKFFGEKYKSLVELEKRYRAGDVGEAGEGRKRKEYLTELLVSAEQLTDDEKFGDAEKIYIEVMSCDMQNIAAYRGLARLYFLKKEFEHAEQMYKCLLKLDFKLNKGNVAEVFEDCLDAVGVYRALEKFEEALAILKKAYKLSPNNPKVIDLLIETSIMLKDKIEAWEMLKRMEAVNPENQKLAEYRAKIEEL